MLGGIRSTGETVGAEGFVTPRSQQGLPTILEMVEGFPATGLRIMSRAGEFFQVARTEVLPVVPSVEQQATPPRSAMHTRAGPLALGDGIVVRRQVLRRRWAHVAPPLHLPRAPEGRPRCSIQRCCNACKH